MRNAGQSAAGGQVVERARTGTGALRQRNEALSFLPTEQRPGSLKPLAEIAPLATFS